MREQRAAMEKELGNMQAKAQGSYQEHQTMQIKVSAFNFLLKCGDLLIQFIPLCDELLWNPSLWHFYKDNLIMCCVVSAGERAAGEPNHSTAAGEWHSEGRSQLCDQSDGEQVSTLLIRGHLCPILLIYFFLFAKSESHPSFWQVRKTMCGLFCVSYAILWSTNM